MSAEWATVTLGQVCETRNGAGIKQEFFRADGVQLVRVSDFTDASVDLSNCIRVDSAHAERWKTHILKAGDVLIATVGSWPPNWSSVVGKAVLVPEAASGAIQNQNTCAVIARPEAIDQRFLFYLLRTESFAHYAANSATGSASQARVPVARLEQYTFQLPPRNEQRAIADILGALDDKIELNGRINRTLEAMVRALFRSWFVDFDPVRAKQQGHPPAGMDDATATLFPAEFEQSALGDIPNGWKTPELKTVLEASNERIGSEEAPEYSSTNDGLEPRSNRYKKSLSASSVKNKLIRKGYLVFGLSRRVLNFGLMRDDLGSVSSAYNVFAVNEGVVSADYLERLIRMQPSHFYGAISASSREGQSVSKEGLGLIRFVLPPKAIGDAFYRICRPLTDRMVTLDRESRTLAAIRDALLPKLLSGELSVAKVTSSPSLVACGPEEEAR